MSRCAVALVFFSLALPSRAAEPAVDFNRDVRPILSDKCFFEISHLTFFLIYFQPAVKQSHTGTVISAIFKAFEAF